jgi:hypothetical protein
MLSKKRSGCSKPKKSKSFLLILFDILNDSTYNEIIHWNSDGTGIIITNAGKLSDTVLPTYFLHNNYKSFLRQLHLYGFHKIRNYIKKGEEQEFKHTTFSKNSSKEEIKQIKRINKGMKLLLKYKKNANKTNLNIDNSLSDNNENDLIDFLLLKNKEDKLTLTKLKQEIEFQRDVNKTLKEQLCKIKDVFDGQSIIIKKIITFKKGRNLITNNNQNKKYSNIKDFFKKYLYFLRIYSPFISISKKIHNICSDEM